MKKIISSIATICILCASVAVEISWEFSPGADGSGIPFDKLIIGAVKDGALTGATVTGPWDENNIYIGYSGTSVNGDDLQIKTIKTLPFASNHPTASEGWAWSEDTEINLYGLQDSLFFMEVYSNNRIVGYSDLSSYADLQAAFTDIGDGYISSAVPWTPTAHAIPEPSSGLLLLIGGALVGLRRKRRVA